VGTIARYDEAIRRDPGFGRTTIWSAAAGGTSRACSAARSRTSAAAIAARAQRCRLYASRQCAARQGRPRPCAARPSTRRYGSIPHADGWLSRGKLYGTKRDLDRALADFAAAVDLDPNIADVLRRWRPNGSPAANSRRAAELLRISRAGDDPNRLPLSLPRAGPRRPS